MSNSDAEPPAAPSRFDWVVFDLGNVVLAASRALPELAGLLGVPVANFTAAYYAHRPDYDRDSDPAAYWSRVAAEAGRSAPFDPELAAELERLDNEGWSSTDPATVALVDELRAAGLGLAVLSNAPASMGRLVEATPWSSSFTHLVFSGDHRMVKPDPAIFRLLLDRLGTTADRAVLIDDRADNIAAATAIGMTTVLFTGADDARSALAELGLPVGGP